MFDRLSKNIHKSNGNKYLKYISLFGHLDYWNNAIHNNLFVSCDRYHLKIIKVSHCTRVESIKFITEFLNCEIDKQLLDSKKLWFAPVNTRFNFSDNEKISGFFFHLFTKCICIVFLFTFNEFMQSNAWREYWNLISVLIPD